MTGAPEFTTERFYVDHVNAHGLNALKRHVNRYKWACERLTQGASVLDLGCGSGYGDFILLGKASKVIGVDVCGEAIDYARSKAVKQDEKRLIYVCADATAENGLVFGLPIKFDAVVCIEMIEHVDHESQKRIIRSVANHLSDDGVLLITTPDRGDKPTTEHHVREMNVAEFVDLLAIGFDDIGFDVAASYGIPDNFLLAVCRKPRTSL